MDVHIIPHNDILSFLNINNKQISEHTEDNYIQASLLIRANLLELAPLTVIDWALANKLYRSKIELPSINLSYIQETPADELDYLVEQLNLRRYDKPRIIRILSYLGLLIDDSIRIQLVDMAENISRFQIFTHESLELLYRWLDYKSICRSFMISRWFSEYHQCLFNSPILLHSVLKCSIQYSLSPRCLDLTNYTTDDLKRLGRNQYHISNIAIIDNQVYSLYDKYGILLDINNIVSVAPYRWNLIALLDDGMIYTVQEQVFKTKIQMSKLNLVTTIDKIIQIVGTGNKLLMITADNKLYGWGKLHVDVSRPIQIPTDSFKGSLVQVAVCNERCIVLTDTGSVYELRFSAVTSDQHKLISSSGTSESGCVIKVGVSSEYIVLLTAKGSVYIVKNDDVGLITHLRDITHISINDNSLYSLNSRGSVYHMDLKHSKKSPQKVMSNIIDIKSYSTYTCAISHNHRKHTIYK